MSKSASKRPGDPVAPLVQKRPRYHHSTIPHDIRGLIKSIIVSPEEEDLDLSVTTTDGNDGNKRATAIESFFVVQINDDGYSPLFGTPVDKVLKMPEQILNLIAPHILFGFDTPQSLESFVDAYTTHIGECDIVPDTYIIVDMFAKLRSENPSFQMWEECEDAHGYDIHARAHINKWMEAFRRLPDKVNIYLQFKCYWRDYRTLWGQSKEVGLSSRRVSFVFVTANFPDSAFHMAQTISAIKDLDVEEQKDLTLERREELVKYGCRGFNVRRRLMPA